MKVVDIKVGQVLEVKTETKTIVIIPQRKSGTKMRIGISADADVIIGNPKDEHDG